MAGFLVKHSRHFADSPSCHGAGRFTKSGLRKLGVSVPDMSKFDVDAMLERYKERAQAVRDRPLPPVAGEERKKFINQAETDFTDFALIANASWEIDEAHLVLKIPLQG